MYYVHALLFFTKKAHVPVAYAVQNIKHCDTWCSWTCHRMTRLFRDSLISHVPHMTGPLFSHWCTGHLADVTLIDLCSLNHITDRDSRSIFCLCFRDLYCWHTLILHTSKPPGWSQLSGQNLLRWPVLCICLTIESLLNWYFCQKWKFLDRLYPHVTECLTFIKHKKKLFS